MCADLQAVQRLLAWRVHWQLTMSTAIDAQEAADTGVLEEILVTAQKRTENVQSVPSSVSVLSTERPATTSGEHARRTMRRTCLALTSRAPALQGRPP